MAADPDKAGLEKVFEFLKLTLAIDGAAIALLLAESKQLASSTVLGKLICTFALACFAYSFYRGMRAYSRGVVMLAQGKYDVQDSRIAQHGKMHHYALALGALCAGFLYLGLMFRI